MNETNGAHAESRNHKTKDFNDFDDVDIIYDISYILYHIIVN